MFVNIVEFPAVRPGKDKEFREWFAWSNGILETANGFISRRLLAPATGKGNYVAIVEHESEETFKAMHASEAREGIAKRVESLLEGARIPRFYQVVVDSRERG